ncbi:hypothetical protein AbraIFM66950_009948 [Aspergillus brasiliensis]|nr:hypothetical protein AbraIFM66950_009948 [Aspergillus brasiliensis]
MAPDNEIHRVPAVQRALAAPEILSRIFECFYEVIPAAGTSWSGRSSLLSCALVSKSWFSEAMRWLWRDPKQFPDPEGNHVDVLDLLEKIPEARRNIYARYIKTAMLKDYKRKPDGLDTVQFPNLQSVWISGRIDLSDFKEIKL